jgi:hypothetical protein
MAEFYASHFSHSCFIYLIKTYTTTRQEIDF